MSENSYFTVVNVTFISSGDLRNFKDKAATFNNNKAVKFLKENGQVNYSIIEVEDADSAKAIILWEYKDKESREKCQDYWNKWFEFDDNYIAKVTVSRGYRTFDWTSLPNLLEGDQ